MPATEDRDNPTTTAVTDASRFFAESGRRAAEGGKAAVDAARGLLDDATEVGDKLFEAWAASAEGSLKAYFEMQNASLAASFPFLDAAMAAQRGVLQQWDAVVRQSQPAMMDAFHAQVRATRRVVRAATPSR